MSASCWFVAAPASGQGKTTVTAALAARARAAGRRVRVFKTGPDFLDPQILARASGAPVYNLDLWMVGTTRCRALLERAAREADLVLVEGAMGLFDGTPSGADLAACLDLPVLLVIDAGAMAQTFAAIVHGLRTWRADVRIAGVIANRVAGAGHARLLFDALESAAGADADAQALRRGWLAREADAALPERHLGLLPAQEIADLDRRIGVAAQALHWTDDELPARHSPDPAPNTFGDADPGVSGPPDPAVSTDEPALAGRTIAVARDAAFCFIYPDNLDVLQALGARLVFFAPLAHEALPPCDALWLPGGYPELHAAQLSADTAWHGALARHHAAGKPILAECGGMMCLFDELVTQDGEVHRGAGLLPGRTRMQTRLAALGLQQAALPEGVLRGHSFHYSRCETMLEPLVRGSSPHDGGGAEPVYRSARLTASYIHFHFASNPPALAALFGP